MAPLSSQSRVGSSLFGTGPHQSDVRVAKQYIFHQQLTGKLVAIGTNPTREDQFRLQGVQWINEVRCALQLPARTFCTACVYYHKFRLEYKDTEYQYQDAAAAALVVACKIEDTLKKSREILCAAHNLKVPPADHLSPDDIAFDPTTKLAIGVERLQLESARFDFRVRYPHKHLIKLGKAIGLETDVAQVAYDMMIDLYRTFAPLKQTCATMAFACVELATLVLEKQQDIMSGPRAQNYEKWVTTRAEVMETILDMLDLYTHFQKSSIVGPSHNIDKFIQIRIKINQEMDQNVSLGRYTEFHEAPKINGLRTKIKTPKTPITPASPSDVRTNGKDVASPATLSPRSSGSSRRGMARGQDGTVRFMLDTEQAKRERETTDKYIKVEYEEVEVEVPQTAKPKRDERGPQPHQRPNGRDDRSFHHNKRIRR